MGGFDRLPKAKWKHLADGALAFVAVGAVVYRFWNLDLAPFILDEPAFLAAARDQLLTGHWVAASTSSPGTQGVDYGASMIWFYSIVQWLFGPSARVSIAAMCLLFTFAQIAFVLAVTRLFDGGIRLFATLLAFVMSSPYQFFWSRLAWNQFANICAFAAVALLCYRGALTVRRAVGIGLVFGIGISSHPMIVPLIAATCVVLFVEHVRTPKALLGRAVPMAAAMLIVNVPYLVHLANQRAPHLPRGRTDIAFTERLLQTARPASLWGIECFFDDSWADFVQWLGWGKDLAVFELITLGACVAVGIVGLVVGLRSGNLERRRVLALGALTAILYPAFYASRGLELQPHYQFPTGWVVPLGLASLLAWTRTKPTPWAIPPWILTWGLAALQLVFIVGWMSYIRVRGGTHGIHYSTPVSLQEEAVRQICEAPEKIVVVENQTALFPTSIQYLAEIEPRCAGKVIRLCFRACPPTPADVRRMRIGYVAPYGGALAVN
jgi:hypothetical protein